VIAFIAKVENLPQIEAARHLMDRHKIEIPKELQQELGKGVENSQQKKGFYHLCEEVASWCNAQLNTNHIAKKYVESRNISDETIRYFQVGYFPGGIASINRFIRDMSHKGILTKDLISSGILVNNGRVTYSPFEERIIFPIRDLLGRACGFGGRIYKKNDERAKYYNSKESPYFQKGQLLFGLNLARKEMRDKEYTFLVEGYTDCVSMVQHGYKNVIATLGTACTTDHLKLLARYVNTLYVLYDGDAAGQKAILRLVELCWEVSLELRILKLPTNEDPASFLDAGGNLEELTSRAEDIFSFFVEAESATFSKKTLGEKIKMSSRIMDIIARVDDQFKQKLLLQKATAAMQVPYDSLKELLEKKNDVSQPEVYAPKEEVNPNESDALEKKLLFAIINNVGDYEHFSIDGDLEKELSEDSRALLLKVRSIAQQYEPQKRFDVFFEGLDEGMKQSISLNCIKFGGDITTIQFRDLVMQFRKQKWRDTVSEIKTGMLSAKKTRDLEKLQALTKQFVELKNKMRTIGLD